MKSRVAIIAAIDRELRPLLRTWKLERSARGVSVYSSERAVAAFAGMGAKRAEIATLAALDFGPIHRILSAGWAGGLHAGMTAGMVRFADAIVDASSGEVFEGLETASSERNGRFGVGLVTLDHVAPAAEKHFLRERYAADMVDMEAATVARIAREKGISFQAIKAVSDECDFEVPGMEKFATPEGDFRAAAFASHVALRPGMWKPVFRLARNSAAGARHLCAELDKYLVGDEETRTSHRESGNGVN